MEEATSLEVAKAALLLEVAKPAILRESVLAMKSCDPAEAITPAKSDDGYLPASGTVVIAPRRPCAGVCCGTAKLEDRDEFKEEFVLWSDSERVMSVAAASRSASVMFSGLKGGRVGFWAEDLLVEVREAREALFRAPVVVGAAHVSLCWGNDVVL